MKLLQKFDTTFFDTVHMKLRLYSVHCTCIVHVHRRSVSVNSEVNMRPSLPLEDNAVDDKLTLSSLNDFIHSSPGSINSRNWQEAG